MNIFRVLIITLFSFSLFAGEKHYELRVHHTVKN